MVRRPMQDTLGRSGQMMHLLTSPDLVLLHLFYIFFRNKNKNILYFNNGTMEKGAQQTSIDEGKRGKKKHFFLLLSYSGWKLGKE